MGALTFYNCFGITARFSHIFNSSEIFWNKFYAWYHLICILHGYFPWPNKVQVNANKLHLILVQYNFYNPHKLVN